MTRDLRNLEMRVRHLESVHRRRNDAVKGREQMPRLAKTIDDGTVTYPTTGSKFPVIFLDGHYTKSSGDEVTLSDRQAETATWVKCISGIYLPPNTVIEVFRQRGLGGVGKGEWWTSAGVAAHPIAWKVLDEDDESTDQDGLWPGESAYCRFLVWDSGDSRWEDPGAVSTAVEVNIFDPTIWTGSTELYGQCCALRNELVMAQFNTIANRWETSRSAGLRRKCKITESGGITAGSSGEVTLYINNAITTGPAITRTAYLNHIHGSEDISENKLAMIEWFGDENKWVIVEADCE